MIQKFFTNLVSNHAKYHPTSPLIDMFDIRTIQSQHTSTSPDTVTVNRSDICQLDVDCQQDVDHPLEVDVSSSDHRRGRWQVCRSYLLSAIVQLSWAGSHVTVILQSFCSCGGPDDSYCGPITCPRNVRQCLTTNTTVVLVQTSVYLRYLTCTLPL